MAESAESQYMDDDGNTESIEEVSSQDAIIEYTVEELLISCVQARPALWDSRLPILERSKTRRDKLWIEIFKEFGENPEFSLDFLQRKWRNLRDTYVRIKGEYTPSGSETKKKKKWEYLEIMSFLNETINFRPTISNVMPSESPSTSSCSSASPVTSPVSANEGRRGKKRQQDVEGALLNALEKVNAPSYPSSLSSLIPAPVSSDINPICQRISSMINTMPQKERTLLEIKLLQVAYEGSKDYL